MNSEVADLLPIIAAVTLNNAILLAIRFGYMLSYEIDRRNKARPFRKQAN